MSEQDYETCPYCERTVVFWAFDKHLKRCMEKECGD